MASNAIPSSFCLTEDYVRQLEKQLEDREIRIHDLRHTVTQKDELLLATSEKLVAAERKRTELETALLNLATDKDEEDAEDKAEGDFDRICCMAMQRRCGVRSTWTPSSSISNNVARTAPM